MRHTLSLIIYFSFFIFFSAFAQVSPKLQVKLDAQAKEIESKVIEWRRHIHQYPELSTEEFKTAAYVAEHLKNLGLEVQTGVAKTGVVGVLKTGKPGPVIALRADMDALPVTERSNLSFASKEKTIYNGLETGVMHACGHDSHVAILMGVADILVKNKKDLKGMIKFIFQPAEEGGPVGQDRGANLMVKEGVLKNPNVEVIFGLHISAGTPVGVISYKSGGSAAANDDFYVKVKGKQSHGAMPWSSIDPIVVSSEIIVALQTIISRQSDLTNEAAVITVGRFNAGIRENIIPEEAIFSGTIRTLDTVMQKSIHERIIRTAKKIAESAGATAEVSIEPQELVTFNDPTLTTRMVPSLVKAAGADNVEIVKAGTGAEDFSFYQKKVPGLFFSVGAMPADKSKAGSHHTPDFYIDESGFITGIRAMLDLTVDYMYGRAIAERGAPAAERKK
ncbi:M20 family metallopeptidase [soil metagenome]